MVQAELAATAPALLHEAMEELLLGTLDGFAQASGMGAVTGGDEAAVAGQWQWQQRRLWL